VIELLRAAMITELRRAQLAPRWSRCLLSGLPGSGGALVPRRLIEVVRAPSLGAVSGRRHDEEANTDVSVARALLREQAPRLADQSLRILRNTGSDNTLYRLGSSWVLRLPRSPDAAQRLAIEVEWLPRLQARLTVRVPELAHVGESTAAFPYRWAVLHWISGSDAWAMEDREGWFGPEFGCDLARAVLELRSIPIDDAPPRPQHERGGSLIGLDEHVRWMLNRADGLLDVPLVTRAWERCLEAAPYDGDPVLLHGDLIPGNLLVARGRLAAVLDWGLIGAGDPAQDLEPAWSVLDPSGAAAFDEMLGTDELTWLRARGFALEHAVGGIVYYAARGHPLADVMRRCLERLIEPAGFRPL
jgi:aminoglycoside phosphotransferase (APT) family kinase protein